MARHAQGVVTRKVVTGLIVSAAEVLCALTSIGRTGYLPRQNPQPAKHGQGEMNRCEAVVRAAPSVRMERVSPIRAALGTAEYVIDDYKVATKMVERSLVDSLFAGG
jgi:hypothetical protein